MYKIGFILCFFFTLVDLGKLPVKKEFETSFPDDNDIQFRINGGIVAGKDEFPFTAMLLYQRTGFLICGAVLISDYYVLTAAHCLHNKVISSLIVRVGDYNQKTTDDAEHLDISIRNYTVHPGFDYAYTFNDIAILRLDEKATQLPHISPICLSPRRDYIGESAVTCGWGSVSVEQFPVDVLNKLTVKILSYEECEKKLTQDLKVFLNAEKICGWEDKKDTCKGDSGGPLVWTDEKSTSKTRYLIGIVSAGHKCGITGMPGFYTRITSFLDWILENTLDDKSICRGK